MLTNIVMLSLLTVPTPRVPIHDRIVVRPRIEVWSSHGDGVFNRGQGVRVYFRADQDAFVTIFRVDTDGRVRVLFPRDPWEDNFVRGDHEFEVQGSGNRTAFYVDDYPGMGYLFGVASADPFEYGAIESGNHWDYRSIADGRVRGDPYVALTELAERIVPEGYADWDYDIVPYYVERQYDYPRFLCYDCHAYVSYPYWDPYWRSCVRFRIVLYDDPYYYPYRYYGGRRVVFVRPFRPQPRFVFKDRDGSGRDRFVTREANRPVNDDRRRVAPTRQAGAGSTGSFIPAPRDAAPRDRNSSGAFQRSREQNERPEDRGSERRQPREDQSNERGNERGNDRGQAPARTERVQPSDRGQSRDERPQGSREERSRGSRDERSQGSRDERPRVEQPRYTPPRETPRAEPRSTTPQREQPRAERPRSEGRSQERPRSEPKAQPQRSEPKSKDSGKEQPELRRRKPE